MSNVEIEDVLSSIRRLVSENATRPRAAAVPVAEESAALVLTPSLRVGETAAEAVEPVEGAAEVAAEDDPAATADQDAPEPQADDCGENALDASWRDVANPERALWREPETFDFDTAGDEAEAPDAGAIGPENSVLHDLDEDEPGDDDPLQSRVEGLETAFGSGDGYEPDGSEMAASDEDYDWDEGPDEDTVIDLSTADVPAGRLHFSRACAPGPEDDPDSPEAALDAPAEEAAAEATDDVTATDPTEDAPEAEPVEADAEPFTAEVSEEAVDPEPFAEAEDGAAEAALEPAEWEEPEAEFSGEDAAEAEAEDWPEPEEDWTAPDLPRPDESDEAAPVVFRHHRLANGAGQAAAAEDPAPEAAHDDAPDAAGDDALEDFVVGTEAPAPEGADDVDEADPWEEADAPPALATAVNTPGLPLPFDEEILAEIVAEAVRAELRGRIGERITQNVRKLVRREIARALETRGIR